MWRPDRGTLRSAGFVLLLVGVFTVTNSQVVYAASGSSESGDLLAPLNIPSSEGVAINGYELDASGGSIVDFKSQALAFALGGLFTLIRLLVGLAGWAIEMAFRFPLLKILIHPAQKVADAYDHVVVDTLGLKGLLLAWAFVFALFMLVRGRVGRGLGEIFLTLLIAAFAASAFVRPDYLLAADGPLGQTQQVAADVAQETVASYDWGGKIASKGPCDGMAGRQEAKCMAIEADKPATAADIARPIQDSITNALIVKPFMLLEYGRILDPAKKADRAAYAVHLKWVTGGYKPKNSTDDPDDPCRLVPGPGRAYCERGPAPADDDDCSDLSGPWKDDCEQGGPPGLTPAGSLLDTVSPVVSDEDRQFAAFLGDLKRAGPVGKACASYAQKPTWWRVGGGVLLLIAALFICGMLLSSAIVLLGTQGIVAGAAAAGGVTFIAAMLPGPPRQSLWKWLSVWGIAMLAVVAVCAFVPFFGIAVDAILTDGPDLMVERILLLDVLAIAGAAGHRRLLGGVTSFGQRMAMRMRYAKVGGTHLPGDTSELGAALAMNSPLGMGAGYGGGLRSFTTGGGRYGLLGTRHRLMGALASLTDGTGMPLDTGRMLADAGAEAGRGLAPLTAAAAGTGLATRLGARGAYGLLIGRRPDPEQLAKWRRASGQDGDGPDFAGGGPGGGPGGPGGLGGLGGGSNRRRDDQGRIVDPDSGEVLHDQHTDRALLSDRAHNRLVRLRGYRILNRGGRAAYGASVGLPASIGRARSGGSQYTQDARQQLRVWGTSVREDGRAWGDAGRHAARAVRVHADDSSSPGPFTGRRLPTTTAPTVPSRPATHPAAGPAPSPQPRTRPRADETRRRAGSVVPGNTSDTTRAEAHDRFQELLRRTGPEAERLRQERDRRSRRDGDGDDG